MPHNNPAELKAKRDEIYEVVQAAKPIIRTLFALYVHVNRSATVRTDGPIAAAYRVADMFLDQLDKDLVG